MQGPRHAAMLCLVALTGCSPYLYAPEITTFSDGIAKVRASQQSLDASFISATNQANADVARPGAKPFILSAACFSTIQPCFAITRPDHPPTGPTAEEAATAALRRADPGVGGPPPIEVPIPRGCPMPPTGAEPTPKPEVSAETMIAALETYSKALAAVTNAKDRAEFDVASTALAASTGALAGLMIGGPPGAGGAAVATLVIELARYGVAVSLDERRFRTLRCAVLRSQDAVGVLGNLIGTAQALEVATVRSAYVADSQAVTFNMSLPHPAGRWDDNVARQQALALSIGNLRGANPVEAAAAMVKANDALSDALRDEKGQFGALATVVGDFATKAGALERAVATR